MNLATLAIVLVIELLLIFYFSRQIFIMLYALFYLPTHHQTLSKTIVTLLFIPGTAIHEFSHAIMARLLGAQVGDIMLYPHKDKETGEFKAGSCEIEKVDPVRLSLIGVAPTIIGFILLSFIVYYMFNFSPPFNNPIEAIGILSKPINYVFLFLLFMISATMFTSKKDIQELFIVIPALTIIVLLFYYAGFRFTLTEGMSQFLISILKRATFVLGITTVVNVAIYLIVFLPTTVIFRLFGLRMK